MRALPEIDLGKYIFFVLLLFFCSCQKQDDSIIEEYSAGDDDESFLFFTDPHLSWGTDRELDSHMSCLQLYYSAENCDFCLCGGDWLNRDETFCQAYMCLHKVNSLADSYFADKFYSVLGNHDTNYQGKLMESSSEYSGIFNQEMINGLLFQKFGRAYYSFETEHTKWLVLDTGIDWDAGMTPYRWEQIRWMGEELMQAGKKHVIVVLHIFASYCSDGEFVTHRFADTAMSLAMAYNAKDLIELDDNTIFDFGETSGSVACFMCGHCHVDHVFNETSIPVICTRRFIKDGVISFDLCRLDWEKGQMIMTRIGDGEDRIINIVS